MKALVTLFILMSLSCVAHAQQIIFSQNFDFVTGYNPPTGWVENHSGQIPWQCGLPYLIGTQCFTPPANSNNTKVCGFPDRHAGQAQICALDANMNNMFLYSPPINLSGVTDAFLQFDSYFLKETSSNLSEGAYIEASVDNGNSWARIFDVPAYPGGFKTWSIGLSSFNNVANLRVGFRYSDSFQLRSGWMIDNIRVVIPAHNDIALTTIGPKEDLLCYVQTGQTVTLGGTVMNNGIDTIHAFTINYKQNNEPVKSYLFSGVNIAPFQTYNFIHPVPDTVINPGDSHITMWAALTGDTIHNNDTQYTLLHGAYFIPHKRLLIEEGTATWNFMCPRGWVYMNDIMSDNDICEVSVHDYDPMEVTNYTDFMEVIHGSNFVPYFMFDRRESIAPENFYSSFQLQKFYFGFAEMRLDGSLINNSLTVNTRITPAVDLSGDYRLVMAITEDNVTGTDSAYAQRNIFSTGLYGPMGGFENKPDPVPATDMHYNFVARKIFPSPDGLPGELPSFMAHNTPYDYSLTTALDPQWKKNKLKAIVMLIRGSDSVVLNAAKLQIPAGIEDVNRFTLNAVLFPNPAAGNAKLHFFLSQPKLISLQLTDISGRQVYSFEARQFESGDHTINIPLLQVSPGFFLLTIATPEGRQTLKLEVIR